MPILGAIDVGSNAIRFISAEVTDAGRLVRQEVQRYALRLGADVFEHGVIGAASAKELERIFADMAHRLNNNKVSTYRAVATSAIREARNADAVLAHLERHSDIRVEVINGRQESGLARQALLRAVGSLPREALLIDLGGGSLELSRARRGSRISLPLGTVRLFSQHRQFRSPMSDHDLELVIAAVVKRLQRAVRRPPPAHLAVGTGGNLQAFARLFPAELQFPAVDMEQLRQGAPTIASQTIEQRAERYGLRIDRAELLLPATAVLLGLARVFAFPTLLAPATGLREELLHQLALPDSVHSEAAAQLKRLGRPLRRAARIARIAEHVFAALSPLHGLWALASRPLVIASYLRDAGRVVDEDDMPNHSAYIARACGSRLAGEHVGEITAAIVQASFARPLSDSPLVEEDRQVAEKLGAILELATVLDGCGARDFQAADLTVRPALLVCGLDRPLSKNRVKRLEQAFSCSFEVR